MLLPRPHEGAFSTLLLLGGPAGLEKILMELGIARRVVTQLPSDEAVDAAALLRGTAAHPRDIVPSLRPDAVLYWEVGRSFRFPGATPTTVRRTLEACGFGAWEAYEAFPDFDRCSCYLPIADRGIEDWYFQRLAPRPDRWVRVRGHPILPVSTRARRLAVVATRSRDVVSVSRGILEGLPVPQLAGAGRILATHRRRRRSLGERRLVVFTFSAADPQPIAVLKVSGASDDRRRIESESSALTVVRACLDDEMRASVPEPLGSFSAGGALVGAETYLAGERRARAVEERRRQFDRAVAWIAEFHRQTEISRSPWDASDIDRWVARPVAEAAADVGGWDERFGRPLLALGSRFVGKRLPRVWCHGDFNESNVSYAPDRIVVVDWERAAPGLPLLDLLYFAMSWAYRTERLTEPRAILDRFRELVVQCDPTDEVSARIWGAIDGYLRHLELDRAFVPLLLALYALDRHWQEGLRIVLDNLDGLGPRRPSPAARGIMPDP